MPENSDEQSALLPRRFGWPMRLFLSVCLLHIFGSSLMSTLMPYKQWAKDLNMPVRPLALPTKTERQSIADRTHAEGYTSSAQRYGATARSVGRFYLPWPEATTTEQIHSATDAGRYTAVWFISRMDVIGRILGFEQTWPMFSPDVATSAEVTRFRLIFQDGTQHIQRLECDPEKRQQFHRWFAEKRQQIHQLSATDQDARHGLCLMLAHRYAHNDQGAALKRIEVFKVVIQFAPPDVDPTQWYTAQSKPPADQIKPVFWIHDAATGKGRSMEASP
jgi:hypothetical protein